MDDRMRARIRRRVKEMLKTVPPRYQESRREYLRKRAKKRHEHAKGLKQEV
jgi:hypothetical protein